MKKTLSVLAIILAPYFIVACSSDSKEDTIPEEPQMTLADYQGVWEDIHNDTAFISISANGEVLYYKQNGVMGRGIGILADNTISITNGYTGSRDELKIEPTINGLRVYGKVGSKTNKGNYTPVWELRKTDETFVNSFAGEVWSWGWTNMCPYFKDGLTQNRYMFTSNNVCTLSYHNNKHGDYIGESYFYIPRKYKNTTKFMFAHAYTENSDKTIFLKYNK